MDIFNTIEVAQIIRTSHASVLRWISKGKLIAIRVGKQYRIRRQDLADFLKVNLSELKLPEPAKA